MSNHNSRDEPRIQVLKCNVCGSDVEFNADAQVTADTILCEKCMYKANKDNGRLEEAVSKMIANDYNAEHLDTIRHSRAERDKRYAHSIRSPR